MLLAGANPTDAVRLQLILLYTLLGSVAIAALVATGLAYRNFFTLLSSCGSRPPQPRDGVPLDPNLPRFVRARGLPLPTPNRLLSMPDARSSSPASSRPAASTSATSSARSASTSRARTAASRRSSASSTCTRSRSPTTRPSCASALYDTAAILLAAGLDPERCILFRQSDVREHTELTWLLSAVTSHGDLNRMHQFKDKSARQRSWSRRRSSTTRC